jgi:long-chain acyl-CoA synthetase
LRSAAAIRTLRVVNRKPRPRRWGAARDRDTGLPSWPRKRPVRWARRALFTVFVLTITRAAYGIDVQGKERLKLFQEPGLIISNHCLHLDMALLLRALPVGFRNRVAIAAAASDIFGNPVRGFGSALLGNAFPFAKEGGGIRDSLENVGKVLDQGFSVLMFPEGSMTELGPMQPFKGGVGLLARETARPVLPMRIDVLRPGMVEGHWRPPRGRIRITIGVPLLIDAKLGYADATGLLEQAVRDA